MSALNLSCPKCQSENTAKLSAIHEQGTANIATTSVHSGIGVSYGGGVAGMAGTTTTSGIQQSGLARRAAPPGKRGLGCGEIAGLVLIGPPMFSVIGMIVLSIILWMLGLKQWFEAHTDGFVTFMIMLILWACLIVIGLVVSARQDAKFNREQWPRLRAEWESKWCCLRCGEMFAPTSIAEGTPKTSNA